jgi:light-regulated signal transduction histidine kinase (bacteriophytochrome)
VSHDLRAPLRTIDGFSKALLEDCGDALDQNGKEHLGRVLAATKRMGELIDDLLELSRVSRLELKREAVDVAKVAREVVAELGARDPDRRVEVAIADELFATGDARLVRIVLENLIGNAWKFTRRVAAPRITVGADARGGKLKAFYVRDNGAGFDMKYVERLCNPFQRLHDAGDFPGTGVGLATVRRIVERHGGRVTAEGAVGNGATFWFTLPVPET